mgnify:CR=1 FL=1|tara:strand:+ start:3517 stop:4824 length:1308 start_codon:yes stop_codon:yes gene_type:complete
MNKVVNKTPHSESIEKSILSCLFQYEDLPEEGTINSDLFFSPAHKIIYHEIQSIPRPVDIVILTQKLTDNKKLASVGGPAMIVEVFTYQPTSSFFKTHLDKLHQYAARRAAIKAANLLLEASYDMSDEELYIELTRAPMETVAEIAEAASPSRSRNEIISATLETFAERVQNKEAIMGWPMGIHELDTVFKGLHPKRIFIIGGFPTSGKTVLALQILWNVALSGTPTLMITLEMPSEGIADRNLIIASRVKTEAVTDPHLHAKNEGNSAPTKMQLTRIRDGAMLLKKTPIYYEDPTGARIASLCILIRKHVKKNGVKVVAADYLQLMRGPKGMTKEQEMASISHTFQGLAKELGICIILLSQLNKDGNHKHCEAINEDADAAINIAQIMDKESEDYRKHIGISIKKDRHGPNTGSFVNVVLNKEYLKFEAAPFNH